MNCIAPKCRELAELGALFCKPHLAAPAGKRGGWISAYRRRQLLGGIVPNPHPQHLKEPPLDASNVARRLWIGGCPPFERDLPQFDILVLCAEEIQPAHVAFHGIVVRCPIIDGKLDDWQTELALRTGKMVAGHLVAGRTVLVTCAMGLNRSALVTGLGLGLVTKMSATTIIDLIRARRSPDALGNHHFCSMLQRYVPGRRPGRVHLEG